MPVGRRAQRVGSGALGAEQVVGREQSRGEEQGPVGGVPLQVRGHTLAPGGNPIGPNCLLAIIDHDGETAQHVPHQQHVHARGGHIVGDGQGTGTGVVEPHQGGKQVHWSLPVIRACSCRARISRATVRRWETSASATVAPSR